MIRTLLVNIIRSALLMIPVVALTTVLSAAVYGIVGLIAGILSEFIPSINPNQISIWLVLIPSVLISAVLSLVACFIIYFVKRDHDVSEYWEKRIEKGRLLKARTVKIILLVHIAFAIAAIVYLISLWRGHHSGRFFVGAAEDNMPLTVFISNIFGGITEEKDEIIALTFTMGVSVAVFQIVYYIGIFMFYYDPIHTCPKCKHIFCVSNYGFTSTTTIGAEYKTQTERMQVGAIKYKDVTVADVYGNVDTTKSRAIKRENRTDSCHCWACGHEWETGGSITYKDSWN